MKIVYCIAGTYNSGGMERVLANKANFWVAHGHEVTIVTTDQRGKRPFFPMDERIVHFDLDVNYEENNGKSFFNKLRKYPFKIWRHKKRLAKLLNDIHADIVVSMFCNDAFILPFIHDGSKKVLEVHFSRFKCLQYERKGIWKLVDKYRNSKEIRIASRYNRFVVLTHEDLKYWGNLSNINVIPNARTFVCDKPAELNNKVILAVGRYDFQKGFERLIDAWAMICRKIEGWKLEIIGDGAQRNAMLQQIEKLGLTDNVVLKKVPASQMSDLYANASIYALSSRFEGLPMVLLEAQSAGLPIVSFACKCGPKDLIEDGVNGFLIEEGDTAGLAKGILRLMEDEALRKKMGVASYLNSEKYAEDTVMMQWMDLFNGLVSES